MGCEAFQWDLETLGSSVDLLCVDIFYLRGILASFALIHNAVIVGLQALQEDYFKKTLL